MSRIGDVNLQIEEQLADLGFQSLEEAIQNGYHLKYLKSNEVKLVEKIEHLMEKEQ